MIISYTLWTAVHCDTCKTGGHVRLATRTVGECERCNFPYSVECFVCGKETATHKTEEEAKVDWHCMTDVEAPL